MRTSLLLASLAGLLLADEPYHKPSQEIVDVLNAPSTPRAIVSPTRTHVLFAEPMRYPPIAVVAAPMLRLAGLRINQRNNGPHRANLDISLVLTRIDEPPLLLRYEGGDRRRGLVVRPKGPAYPAWTAGPHPLWKLPLTLGAATAQRATGSPRSRCAAPAARSLARASGPRGD